MSVGMIELVHVNGEKWHYICAGCKHESASDEFPLVEGMASLHARVYHGGSK